jgi:hypothetical protein
MHRAILIAWLPWFLWLVAATGMLWLVLRFSGARLQPAKLRKIHSCEGGSVQTLSFVLTLPIFILLLMFIVQVAELMVGIGVVHYAAFAAARAATVWIPAVVPPNEPANILDQGTVDENFGMANHPLWLCNQITFEKILEGRLWKYQKIWSAAALACTPLAPSRDLARPVKQLRVSDPAKSLYTALSPSSMGYPRIRQLIDKKLNYVSRNTWIIMSGLDRDSSKGPTYNPYPGHYVSAVDWIPWNPREIGWEDPVTIEVGHYFALLPGPGRFLATALSPAEGVPDQVSPAVKRSKTEQYQGDDGGLRLYYVLLTAKVTLSNEGLKSVLPYVQSQSDN